MKEQLVESVIEKYSENVSDNKSCVFLSCNKIDHAREEIKTVMSSLLRGERLGIGSRK